MQTNLTNIHQGQPVLRDGAPPERAKAAMILIHGRGADAASIMGLARELAHPEFAYFAPQANGSTWYPYPFIQPIRRNQPYLDSALHAVGDVFKTVNELGIPNERVILLGFSQGACLSLEYSIRTGGKFGGVIGLSGGLIGEPGTTWDFKATLDQTPVFLGCDTADFHIPAARVHESAEVLARHGAQVTKRLYPGMGHTINEDELLFVRDLMARMTA